jgi:uncharacterized protein YecE (DUF72 family)
MTIRVGPAGWSYPDWEGRVYPRRKPKGFHALKHLARYFDCLEINSTFYGTPSARNCAHWAELVHERATFRFTAKLQQIFTHEPIVDYSALASDVRAFHAGLQPLADAHRLAALLVQFPSSFRRNAASEERLRWIAETFGGWPLVLELRARSWFAPEPLAWLRGLGYTLAALDLPPGADRPDETDLAPSPLDPRRAPLAYLRLHGRNAAAWFDPRAGRDQKYDYLYGPDELREIVGLTRRLAQGADETYVITNNHFSGKAVANALELLAELGSERVLGPVELLEAFPALATRMRADAPPSLFGP